MGNKSSKSKNKNKNSSSEIFEKHEEPENNLLATPSKIDYNQLKNEDISDIEDENAENIDPHERPESPMKRARHCIKKHGFFGTIERKVVRKIPSSKTNSLLRIFSQKKPTKPVIATTDLNRIKNSQSLNESGIKLIQSTQSTPMKPFAKLDSFNKTYSDLDLSQEIILDEETFNKQVENGYTLQAVESTGQEILEHSATIEPAQDVLSQEIKSIARDIVQDVIADSMFELQQHANEQQTNASLSEDQYSGQLSSRNNSPKKVRKLSENQKLYDSDIEETKVEAERAIQAANQELENSETNVASRSSIDEITPAIVPEKFDVHDISTFSVDEAREIAKRPSVREGIESTTLDARNAEKIRKINENLEVMRLLQEQAIAKEKIHQEILKTTIMLNEFENKNSGVLEKQESVDSQNHHGISNFTSVTSNESINAPLNTIETYLPTMISSDSIANEINTANSASKSTLSVSKTSQESGQTFNSESTIGRTMKREGDMRSINLAKERPAGTDDTRVIASHTDQKSRKNCKETSQKQTVSKKNNLKQTTINPPAEDKLNDSDYQTPKVPLEESIYETPKVGLGVKNNDNLGSTSNLSTSTLTSSRCDTPNFGSPGKGRDNKGRRPNRRRNKSKRRSQMANHPTNQMAMN